LPTNLQDSLFASPQKRNTVVCLALVVVTLALYNPVNQNPFINCDDPSYITENPYIHSGLTWDTVRWAMTSTGQAGFWHPLTWLSHALDIELFHFNPAGHHLFSLLIHSLNAALLFLLLISATKRAVPSMMVAALFALHPLNVESVAWAAERKNVLCTLFVLATVGAYGWYASRPGWKRYLAAAVLFACALASKPMAVTLPFALLLLDYWPLERVGKKEGGEPTTRQVSFSAAVAEKIPLLILSALTCYVTMIAQRAAGATRSSAQIGLASRLSNAVVAYAAYLWKLMWPLHLTPVYPHPGNSLPAWQIAASLVVLAAITASAMRSSKKYFLAGWLWFLGILFPSIGIVQVGDQAMADRFAYIAEIGIFVAVVWALADVFDARRIDARRINVAWRAIPAVAVLAFFAALTHRQIAYWHSSYDLWTHALAITQNNFVAEDNMGGALLLRGEIEAAYPHFVAASRINPQDPMSRSNLGTYAQSHGRFQEALDQYDRVISLTSDSSLLAQVYANRGAALRELGNDGEARKSFDESLRRNPNQFNAWIGLGLLAEKQGGYQEAAFDLGRSVELQPTAEGYLQLGHTFEQLNRKSDAMVAYDNALKIDPDLTATQQPPTRSGKR
jgi:tetratricopeptide (TPR) repeat protein